MTHTERSSTAIHRESLLPPLWVLIALLLALFGWLVHELREIVVLLVVGYFLAYATNPALIWLERKRIPRIFGFFIVWGGLLLGVGIIAITALPTVWREAADLLANLPNYLERAKGVLVPMLDPFQEFLPASLRTALGNQTEPSSQALLGSLPAISPSAFQGVLSGVGAALLGGYSLTLTLVNFLLLPFIVFYLSIDFQRIHSIAMALVPTRARSAVRNIVREIDRNVSGFVRGQILVASILFVLYAIGLGLTGIELWFLLAVIAGFGNLIPYVGTITGIVLSSVMALVTFGDWWHLLMVWAVFFVVQILEGTVITPRLMGKQVGLSPLIVILAIVAGGSLFGLLGVFLAVPGAAVIKVLVSHSHKWLLSKIA